MRFNRRLFKEAFKAGYKDAKKKLNESGEGSSSKFDQLRKLVYSVSPTNSAWTKGVADFADDMIFQLKEYEEEEPGFIDTIDIKEPGWSKKLEEVLLNGARDWEQFSRGGNGLVYNEAIAKALCSPSELRKTDGGRRRPNAREDWLDVEARALYQAFLRVEKAFKRLG